MPRTEGRTAVLRAPSRSLHEVAVILGAMAARDAESTDRSSSAGAGSGSDHPKHAARKDTKRDKPLPPTAKRKKAAEDRRKAVSDSGAPPEDSGGGRYTSPIPAAKRGPSPRWVPVLMFALWAIGLAMIMLNYMGLLPGSADGGNGWYLMGGLALILGGIVTATQYR